MKSLYTAGKEDNEIIELYWERNEAAITATAEKYGGYCHTISYNILHNNEDAEELFDFEGSTRK